MQIKGAQIVIETLIEQGAEVVFGYPGGTVLDIYNALYCSSDRIKHVISAHEQGAAHAADGYARATGKVGVVLATSGPGATNLVTGIANAYLDSIPLVAITGNVATGMIGRDSFQEVDIFGITMPIIKHNYFCNDVTTLADTIREAFKIAKSGRPGPVLIDIPKDVQNQLAEYTPCPVAEKKPNVTPSLSSLEEAAELIANAERPFIFCGGGAIASDAGDAVAALAEKMDSPIGLSLMGLSAIPAKNPRNLGLIGMHGHFSAGRAIQEADLVIAAGVRFSDRATGDKSKYCKDAKIIHIDIDPAELEKNIPVYMGIAGDLKEVCEKLAQMVEKKTCTKWWEHIASLKKYEQENGPALERVRLTPYGVIDAVAKATNSDTPIATDVGQHQMWVAQRYPFENKRTMVTSGGLGTMGFGMGGAIGAAVATGKRTVLFTGDGSFGMNLNELATAVSQNLPLVIVVMNNGVLGMVRQWQTIFYEKRYAETTLNRATDFVKLAEAFGAKSCRATTPAEMEKAVEYAFSQSGPVLIDAIIDKDERVLPMIPPGRSVEEIMMK